MMWAQGSTESAAAMVRVRQLYDQGPSMFHTAGPQAARLASLGSTMIVVGTIVFVVVMAILLIPLWRRRNAWAQDEPPVDVDERAWVLYGGAATPALVLAGIFVLTLGAYGDNASNRAAPLTIEVIGHQWWWEVRYPDLHVLTANEIHLPAGRAAKIVLQSADVIHSFWVPNLAGKTDVIPGVTNVAWLQADAPGTWRGACAEYCGMQHAHMALSVVAQTGDDFARWAAHERAASSLPTDSASMGGARAFLATQCVYCHTVRGTQASGRAGPDLTHLASRLTLASGTLANSHDNLSAWIADPARVKPGTTMPAVPLSAAQRESIVTYLESLR